MDKNYELALIFVNHLKFAKFAKLRLMINSRYMVLQYKFKKAFYYNMNKKNFKFLNFSFTKTV